MDQLTYLIGISWPFALLSLFLVTLIGILVARQRWHDSGSPSLNRSLQRFKVSLILLSICMGIAAFTAYQFTADLNRFSYPDGPTDVQTAEQILDYLQQYHRVTMTNTYALLWFVYAFVVWFLTTLYAFARSVVKATLAHPHS